MHTEMMAVSGMIVNWSLPCFVGERLPLIFPATARGHPWAARNGEAIGSRRSGSWGAHLDETLAHYFGIYDIVNLYLVHRLGEALIYTENV